MDDDSLRTGQDVVREVLAALAPGELPYVASVLEAYRIAPWTLTGEPPGGRQGTWAPFVLGFVAETVVSLAAGESAARPAPAGRGRIAALLDLWRRPRIDALAQVPDTPVPAFDHVQLREVWTAATNAATDHGYSRGDREAFAAAVVAALAAGHLPRQRRPPNAHRVV
ncbi:hypothetical protein DMB66_05510 [Actinoplanes sp. ATCC 53533]|uniref:hypothetical protein n=1 Tax=Actinoplanes sp. ATCC 53533 TaxID=1288362 RepID=UPI000F791D82|nr:hypothetical protein [Actinoplanes sp. ATCC 53533]RSM72595.1 hypothetical protein DMB66_05510 [Actinoplanes sp. ATCC 53533]